MYSYSLFLLVVALFLVPHSHANAVPKADEPKPTAEDKPTPVPAKTLDGDSSDSAKKDLTKSNNLKDVIYKEYAIPSDFLLKSGNKVLKDVIADISAQKDERAEVKVLLEELNEFTSKVDKFTAEKNGDLDEEFSLFYNMKIILDSFLATDAKAVQDVVLSTSLKNNGVEKIETEYSKHFLTFFEKFEQEVDKFWSSLTAEEQKEYEPFMKWNTDIKAEKDVNKKTELFGKFFEQLRLLS